MAAPMAQSTVLEEHLRGIMAIFRTYEAKADALDEYRTEMRAMQEGVAASNAKHEESIAASKSIAASDAKHEASIAASNIKQKADLVALHTAMSALRKAEDNSMAEMKQLRSENTKLRGDISKLQAEGVGSKDAIKSLKVIQTKHANVLDAYAVQLDRMHTIVSHLEVEKTYESVALGQQPDTSSRQGSSSLDHSETFVRSPSMTLQGSPIEANIHHEHSGAQVHCGKPDDFEGHEEFSNDTSSDDDIPVDTAPDDSASEEAKVKRKQSPLDLYNSGTSCKRLKQDGSTNTSGPPLIELPKKVRFDRSIPEEVTEGTSPSLSFNSPALASKSAGNEHDEDMDVLSLHTPSPSLASAPHSDKSAEVTGNKKGVARKSLKVSLPTAKGSPESSKEGDDDLLTSDILINDKRSKAGSQPYDTGYKSQSAPIPTPASSRQAVPSEKVDLAKGVIRPARISSKAARAADARAIQTEMLEMNEHDEEETSHPNSRRPKRDVRPRVPDGTMAWRDVPAANLRR